MSSKIAIIKFDNVGKPVWNRLTGDKLIDKIIFSEIFNSDFPLFKYETETAGSVKKRKAGDFAISFSYLQKTLSHLEKNVMEFFRGGTRNYIFWIGIETEGLIFTGTFTSDSILSDFTYNQNKYDCTILVKDMLYDWALYAATRDTAFSIEHNEDLSFESYIKIHHLNQLVSHPSNVILPDQSLSEKCGENIKFTSEWYNEIRGIGTPFGVFTDWSKINRLETWEGLSRGLAFDYDLALNNSVENVYNLITTSRTIDTFYNIVIKWKEDIANETPYILTKAVIHKEYTIPKNKKYLFVGYRHHIYPGLSYFTIINGILYAKGDITATDTRDNSSIAQPFFHIDTENTGALYHAPGGGHVSTKFDRNTEVLEIELPLYSCNGFSMGANYLMQGSIAYARLFCKPDDLDFSSVQRFAVKSYQRYTHTFGLKGKEIEVPLDSVRGINLYKPVQINDGDGIQKYEVDQIDKIDLINKRILLKVVQLPEGF